MYWFEDFWRAAFKKYFEKLFINIQKILFDDDYWSTTS